MKTPIGLLLAFLATASCGDGSTTVPPPAPPPSGGATVQTVGTSFQPASLTIAAGTTVTWVDTDAIQHTVTSGQGSASTDVGRLFDQPLADRQTFQFTFQTAGTYPYFCRIHETMNMRGTIIVTPSGGTGGTGGTGGAGGAGGTGGSGGY